MKLDVLSLLVLSAFSTLSWSGQPSGAFTLQSIPKLASGKQLQRLVFTLHVASNSDDDRDSGRRQKAWDQRMQELKEYYIEFGTYNVSGTHINKKDKWASLAKWLRHVRERRSRIPKERLDQLIALGIPLKEPQKQREDQQWEEMFNELVEYKNATGHTRVPRTVPKLGNWVITQRRLWKKGTLRPDRKKKLESINFEVVLRERSYDGRQSRCDKIWLERLDDLIEFHEEHGHFWPNRRSSNATEKSLGIWANGQRQYKKRGQLQNWRKEALEKIGFPWNKQEERDASWFANLYQLKEVLEQWDKDGRVGNAYSESALGKSLVSWVRNQRYANLRGDLDPNRKKSLDEVGFEWEFPSDK